ncbi:MAG TPA: SIS domain-containing protein [Candidatus Pelagibacter bacterium]|jgi:arabinose-5-phosphate isomerase|nr:arabinose-5-phosphate isomerase [Pelagibacteraceae bacterium]HJN84431.1 SIS domain-containing protein [Candidatus Pelagibacter bacterium]|tara:strand:+ start:700 stop:1674 length:975 start_codon:yes stop_codon:yes gene_type:complete
MKKDRYNKSAKKTIDLQISALNKLKKSIGSSFNKAVKAIGDCQSKCILVGVGKSGHLANLIASSLNSIGASSFALQSAADAAHGDLGAISTSIKKDILILISNSGSSSELNPIISYSKKHNITLIGITSKKNSSLYKSANIKILIPEVKEAGEGAIVPSSSLITQASIGSSLVIAVMKYKKHGIKVFRKFHPGGTLSKKLLSSGDLMVKPPFVSENYKMNKTLKILSQKKLGLLIVRNKKRLTSGLLVDGDVKRASQKYKNLHDLKVKDIMTKKPLSIDKDMLAVQCLKLMNSKHITSLLVHKNNKKNKTIGVLHIHKVIENVQ